MAFLDNLVSDLVRSSTGINARGFVRMVGGKNILLLGGAALAGAIAADRARAQTSSSAAPPPPIPGEPPPLPPSSGSAAEPPPLPPPILPEATPESATLGDTEPPPELVYAIVRTMVAAALVDGRMAEEEKALIHKHLGRSGLRQEQIGQIHKDLVIPPSHQEIASLASTRDDGELLYRFAALVTLADEDVSELEQAWLSTLAETLAISKERKEEMEKEIFVRSVGS